MRCAICTDFDLCLTCFTSGVEINAHKKDHDYRVIDVLDFPIFEPDWGADEELLLVEGLELFGLGNWETISEHIGTKNASQVKRHYHKIYVRSESWPYPDLTDKFDMSPGKRNRARGSNYGKINLIKWSKSYPNLHVLLLHNPLTTTLLDLCLGEKSLNLNLITRLII
jgi:Myb-like DNA-binding domain/Zinc finger, ZZ type